jgi:hypothetical protein
MADRDRTTGRSDWQSEERYWKDNFRNRPYVQKGREFDEYRPGYQYGVESASRYQGRSWNEAEPELRSGWDRYENKNESTWEQIKDSVRDAWNRVTGGDDHESRSHRS